MKKFSKKIILCGMTALFAAALISCSDNGGGHPDPIDPPDPNDGERPAWLKEEAEWPLDLEELENTVSEVSGNLVLNGDADGAPAGETLYGTFGGESGVKIETVDGGVTGKCFRVSQERNDPEDDCWQEFNFDLTPFYGQGKSFYFSFKIKKDPNAKKTGPVTVSYAVYSGALQQWARECSLKATGEKESEGYMYYDYSEGVPAKDSIQDPWSNPFLAKNPIIETALGVEELDTSTVTPTDEWVQCNYVIPATAIEAKVDNSGLYNLQLSMYMGEDGPSGYSYLIDDIVVKDLNKDDIERLGRTWFDPDEVTGSEE